MTESEQIEEILWEASAYGLRIEVINAARKFMDEGHNRLLSYQMAFNEWVKLHESFKTQEYE